MINLMNRYSCTSFAVIFLLLACHSKPERETPVTSNKTPVELRTTNNPIDSARLIIPGERLGHIFIGENAENLDSVLGKPDISDAAMGKAWLTWNGNLNSEGNPARLDIYTTYKDSTMQEKTVQQIRTTSPYFSTASGVGVQTDFNAVQQKFPSMKEVANYSESDTVYKIFDDQKAGIAFEFRLMDNRNVCSGIIIHMKNKPVTDTYIYLHPDMALNQK